MNRSGLNLFADGEEGAKGVIHRLGVREVLHDIRIKDCDIRTLLEQVGILAANCCGLGGSAGGLRILPRVLFGLEERDGR